MSAPLDLPVLAAALHLLAVLEGAGTLGAALLAGSGPVHRARGALAVCGGAWVLVLAADLLAGPGPAPLIGAGSAALVVMLAVALEGRAVAWICAGLAAIGIAVGVLGSHGAGYPHIDAVLPALVHVLALSTWAGLLAVGAALRGEARRAARRMASPSSLPPATRPLVAWILVAGSGAWLLILHRSELGAPGESGRDVLALGESAVVLALGALVIMSARRARTAAADRAGDAGSWIPRVVLPLLLLALVLAAALDATAGAPTGPDTRGTSPATVLTGRDLPPAPGPLALLTAWRPDALVLAGILLLGALLVGVLREGPRGRRLRAAAGLLLLAWISCGPLGVYAPVLSSAHLIQQGLLLVLVGPLLASAVPAPRRLQGLLARDPWLAPVLALGPTGAVVLVHATPWLLRPGLASIPGHELLLLLPALAGALTWWSLDRGVLRTVPRILRAVLAALPVAGLAASGLGLALGHVLLVPDRFGATGRSWRADALADQQTGGWFLVILAALALAALVARSRTGRAPRRA
ncbi:hypothetical protein DEO23_06235 [Brachybacterium endophyticum]|uniref:Copper resistance protein D domain-containing protein n=1 Tax=Brachybacterium endophyticum TaxID=2182385 RepID=A0A2U2RL12_9MICO|nr:cytochrome c oxidase assembly protein [Brachybacterium endophyticum]PWH06553.1 hypothetical protein DEO23_06235 [Brachybacterium endophyticum]